MGIAYLTFHIHKEWQTIVNDLCLELNSSAEEAFCLVTIFKYMASECEDESIVIEQSLRENFFDFLDEIAESVFS